MMLLLILTFLHNNGNLNCLARHRVVVERKFSLIKNFQIWGYLPMSYSYEMMEIFPALILASYNIQPSLAQWNQNRKSP